MYTNVKICGVTQASEVKLLDEVSVTYAGLWYGITKGRYDLDLETLRKLSLMDTQKLKFVLVTMQQDIAFLRKAVEKSHVCGIQFHGFQLPAFVQKIKQCFGNTIQVFKVLHVQNNHCMEEGFIKRYIDSGVDTFILDSYQDKNRIGSTGMRLSDDFLNDFFSRWKLQHKVMIAGGVDEHTIESLYVNHNPYGVDIDSSARCNGIIDRQRINRIMSADVT